jgi:hypothetical protein
MYSSLCRLPQLEAFREADQILYHNQKPMFLAPLTPNNSIVLLAEGWRLKTILPRQSASSILFPLDITGDDHQLTTGRATHVLYQHTRFGNIRALPNPTTRQDEREDVNERRERSDGCA